MKKSSVLFYLGFIGFLYFGYGQYQIKNLEELNGYNAIPEETVYIHYNDGFFLAGEYLYYKLYCLNAENTAPSTVSKVAYVELVSKNKQPIFKHKIRLKSGLGQGDFFIPTTTPSGNYKLIGYTQWMRNADQGLFFQSNITIVNPYQELQEPLQPYLNDQRESSQKKDGPQPLDSIEQKKTGFFSIDLAKKKYGKRKAVTLNIKNMLEYEGHGNYSISVRKRGTLIYEPPQTAKSFSHNLKSNNTVTDSIGINDIIYLPELRGELFSGKILSKEDNKPLANEKVSVSISQNHHVLKIVHTNNKGIFYFNLNEHRTNNNAILQLLGSDQDQKKIELSSVKPLNYDKFSFEEFSISEEIYAMILERSIYNQIENAYFEKKEDSTTYNRSIKAVYRNLPKTYLLDDYKRFPTIKETVVEIIANVWLKKIKEGYTFQVRKEDSFLVASEGSPLVMVDGILVQHLDDLLDYKAKEIKKISVSRHVYYIGPQLFQGILAIETNAHNYSQKMDKNNMRNAKIPSPFPQKNYYSQNYDDRSRQEAKRLPDYRSQLLWRPNLALNSKENSLTFYTSDNSGDYEVCLEGFTHMGEPISISKFIHVE